MKMHSNLCYHPESYLVALSAVTGSVSFNIHAFDFGLRQLQLWSVGVMPGFSADLQKITCIQTVPQTKSNLPRSGADRTPYCRVDFIDKHILRHS